MTETVEIPVWLLLIIAALAVLATLDDVLLPTARWYLRRHVNKVIDDVNARLRLELPTFQITKRRVLIDRLIYDPEVMKTVGEVAAERGVSRDSLTTEVSRIAREMVPAFNAYFYFRLGYRCARWLLRAFYRVRLAYAHEQAMADIPPDTAVVFFINHRSNADYLLVTYLASGSVALSYGAGEWARVWPFRSLLRLAGAYILRRKTADPLYRKVLERYVQMATEACVPHAIFAEGKLSRDGAISPPKLGMLGYITKTFDPAGPYDIMFIPVATNFDRVAEERTLVANPDTDFRGRGGRFLMSGTAKFVLKLAWRKMQGRSAGFGVACANFGEPLSLRAWSDERGVDLSRLEREPFFSAIEELGAELTDRITDVVPVLAVPLVSLILTEADGPLPAEEIKGRALRWLNDVRELGAHIGLREGSEAAEIEAAVNRMRKRRLIAERSGGELAPVAAERALLTYYAASIVQVRTQLQRKLSGPE